MNIRLLYLLLPAFLLGGCSESDPDYLKKEDMVPISLTAGNKAVSSTNTYSTSDVWHARFFASTTSEDYTTFTDDNEWVRDAEITSADGTVQLAGETVYYPNSGNWVYVVGVSPAATPSDGKVIYNDAVGTTDLLYAKEVRANKWKAERFGSDKKINFGHLYTQLTLWAKKGTDIGSSEFKVSKIVLKQVAKQVEVVLNSGATTWSDPADRDLAISESVLTNNLSKLTTLMLAPASSYQLEIETNMGKYVGSITPIDGDAFLAGYSHKVTLTFSGINLNTETIAVEEWHTVNKDLNVN